MNRRIKFALFVGCFLIVLDIYVFAALKTVIFKPLTKQIVTIVYWSISVICIGTLLALPFLNYEKWNPQIRTNLFAAIFILFLAKFLAVTIFIVDDLRRGITWVIKKLFNTPTLANTNQTNGVKIPRSQFLSWLGLGVGGSLMATLFYGFSNRYNYKIHKTTLTFNNLPTAFDGFTIVQLSDIHSGSFTNKDSVAKGVVKANDLKPDIIFFTGDLVNDKATEIEPYKDLFNKLQAPHGVYSILGNHDYGKYAPWPTKQAEDENLAQLKAHHADMGWKLLLNENVKITKNNEHIALVGIENWGKGFFQFGDMKKAYNNVNPADFTILLSHDPSHWSEQVLPDYKNIDLMLSGHTHGAQFGIEIPGLKWSPIQWRYKQWAGLYTVNNQNLYVNRGFGFLGYPGRVGIMPEITHITLRKATV